VIVGQSILVVILQSVGKQRIIQRTVIVCIWWNVIMDKKKELKCKYCGGRLELHHKHYGCEIYTYECKNCGQYNDFRMVYEW